MLLDAFFSAFVVSGDEEWVGFLSLSKCKCCCALLTRDVIFAYCVRSSVISSTHLALLTDPSMFSLVVYGERICITFVFLKLTRGSFVLLTGCDRLLLCLVTVWLSHHHCCCIIHTLDDVVCVIICPTDVSQRGECRGLRTQLWVLVNGL